MAEAAKMTAPGDVPGLTPEMVQALNALKKEVVKMTTPDLADAVQYSVKGPQVEENGASDGASFDNKEDSPRTIGAQNLSSEMANLSRVDLYFSLESDSQAPLPTRESIPQVTNRNTSVHPENMEVIIGQAPPTFPATSNTYNGSPDKVENPHRITNVDSGNTQSLLVKNSYNDNSIQSYGTSPECMC